MIIHSNLTNTLDGMTTKDAATYLSCFGDNTKISIKENNTLVISDYEKSKGIKYIRCASQECPRRMVCARTIFPTGTYQDITIKDFYDPEKTYCFFFLEK